MTRMTFSQQLRAMRGLLALFAALAAMCLFLTVATYQWAALIMCVLLLASFAPLLHAEWRLFARQRPIAGQAQQLRQITRSLPAGMNRFYANTEADKAVFCARGRLFDEFATVEGADIIDLDRAGPGDLVSLPATTYRIRRTLPVVWRHVGTTEAVKGSDGQFHAGERTKTRARDIAKAFRFNHQTGLLTPDRDELAEILYLIGTANRTWDIPS